MSDQLLVDTLVKLARVPSAVALGSETLMAPDDPILVDYVQAQLRPRFVDCGAYTVLDLPLNQFAVQFGNGHGPCLALMAYTPTQHHNMMTDPWSGRIAVPPGLSEPAIYGQGVTQNKAHQACLIAIADWLVAECVELNGTLSLCLNNEGRSSHDCSNAILDHLPRQPDLLIELLSTGFKLSVGNRGRVDLHIHVTGQATHSSDPPADGRVIDTVGEVIAAVTRLNQTVRRRRHPSLGHEQAVVYQVLFDPLAPHTLPSYAKVTVDRRLLPGTDPVAAARELREALHPAAEGGCDIHVEGGVMMLPAVLDASALEGLAPLEAAISNQLGHHAERIVYGGAFDAGGPIARGVPTVMFGLPDEGDLLGDDYALISDLEAEFRILKETITRFFPGR